MEDQASNSTVPDTNESPMTDPAVAGSTDAAEPSVPENSREADLMKAEAVEAPISPPDKGDAGSPSVWNRELKRFNDIVNENLATKEKLKIIASDSKVRPEYLRDWTNDCNRFFALAVNLKKRQKTPVHQKEPQPAGTTGEENMEKAS
jgi:hypothetical protein